jgi:hypothetical protein
MLPKRYVPMPVDNIEWSFFIVPPRSKEVRKKNSDNNRIKHDGNEANSISRGIRRQSDLHHIVAITLYKDFMGA